MIGNTHYAPPVNNLSRAELLSFVRPFISSIYQRGKPFEAVMMAGDSLLG